MNFFRLPYDSLTKFVIGSLLLVFISAIFTEVYLSSPVLDERKFKFSCLANHLRSKNKTDEIFSYASLIENSSDCVEIINQYKLKIADNTRLDYFATKNISALLCSEIEDKNCNSSIFDNKGSSSASDQSEKNCSHLRDEISSLKNNQEDLKEIFKATKEKCKSISLCYGCIKGKLLTSSDDNYETSMLHVLAANLTSTVIEFRFWEYFKVTSRVEELLNDAGAIRDEAIIQCNEQEIKCSAK